MAFEAKSIDEETTGLVDSFDAMIAPRSVWRNNNNKLYLVLKSIGAGFSKIREIVLALKYRFDPRYCDDADLESAMFITGETRIPGKTTMLRVLATNNDEESVALLPAGTYIYTNTQGQPFSFTAPETIHIAPFGYSLLMFSSRDIGPWPVAGESNATVIRVDGEVISDFISFDALDNTGALGRLPESSFAIRQRLITDTRRQDVIRELELAIRALPTIFECNLVFNADNERSVTIEDGTVLLPKELLIIITGVPTQELAEVVLSRTFYKTHVSSIDDVVWYHNPLLATGKYPVYYMFHKKKRFYLTVNYLFEKGKITKEQADVAIDRLLRKYKFITNHIPEINEPLLYKDLDAHGIIGVMIRKIYIQVMVNGALESVSNVIVPPLMLPELVAITYIAEETHATN